MRTDWRTRQLQQGRRDIDVRRKLRVLCAGRELTGPAQQAGHVNAAVIHASLAIAKDTVDTAMDAAQCIGCGACVAACKNASAALFTSAKITHLALLPQGQVERRHRVVRMVDQMDHERFGMCSNEGKCQAVCPKEISIASIAQMNREYLTAKLSGA